MAVASHLALLAVWYLFVKFGNVPKFVMPSPGPPVPPPPPIWVCVVIWIEAVIHESSPLSEKTLSLGSS